MTLSVNISLYTIPVRCEYGSDLQQGQSKPGDKSVGICPRLTQGESVNISLFTIPVRCEYVPDLHRP